MKIKDKLLFGNIGGRNKILKIKNLNSTRGKNISYNESMKKGALSKIKPNYPVNRRNIRKNNTPLNFINIIIMVTFFILSSD